MKDQEIVQRFIELRVQGWTFRRIADELNVSQPTLIAWSRKHQHLVENLRAIARESLMQTILSTSEDRMKTLGEQLQVAEIELAKRDITALSTSRLLSHIESLRRQIQGQAGKMQFVSTVDNIPEDEYGDRIHIWKP